MARNHPARMTRAAARSLTSMALLGCACSYTTHATLQPYRSRPSVPAPKLERIASEVHLVSKGGLRFREDEAKRVRDELSQALEILLLPRHPEDYEPARFRVVAELEREGLWSIAYIVLVPAPFLGAPIARVAAKVSVEVELGHKRYVGEAKERIYSGFWYNYNAREKAVGRAFRKALATALEQAQPTGAAPAGSEPTASHGGMP